METNEETSMKNIWRTKLKTENEENILKRWPSEEHKEKNSWNAPDGYEKNSSQTEQ